MWVERRKIKTRETVEIPRNFILFLVEAHREIAAGEEPALLESDDLLQYEEFDFAYGGLFDSETGEYSFRYFADNGSPNIWEINLSKSEIEMIIEGEMRELNLWSCESPSCGCKFANKEDFCQSCDWVEQPEG